MKTSLISGIIAAALVSASALAAASASEEHGATAFGDPEKGKEKAGQICQACHGLDGNGIPVQPVWPKLAGQHPAYIYKQLNNFKNNERFNAQMTPMAMPLTDEEMRNLAAYYSGLDQSGGTAEAELVALGESVYRAGNPASGVPACSGCHGPAGLGNNLARFPRISGQHSEYTAQTLRLFRDMERQNDPNGMMRGVAAKLTDAEIDALAAYIEGLSQ
jgi:cytochrome c553